MVTNISVDNDAQSFEIPINNNSSITAPGDHILAGFYDAWSFETPRINNLSVTTPSPQIVLGDDIAPLFETPLKKTTMSLQQVPIFC